MPGPDLDSRIETYYVHVRGVVQGVGFRHHTVRRAHALGVRGWVANLDDGSVEVMIQGSANQVDLMLEWLRRYHEDMVRVPGASRISHREHAKIVERILARDPEGAAKAMEKHLRRSSALYRKHESARTGKPSRPALRG